MQTYDLIVVGAGRSGLEAARYAASVGAKTALVERHASGGRYAHEEAVAAAFAAVAAGVEVVRRLPRCGIDRHPPSFRFSRVSEWVREVAPVPSVPTLKGVDYIVGEASFSEPRVLQVDGRLLRGKRILLATGSYREPSTIEGADALAGSSLASLQDLRILPRSIAFVGALPSLIVPAQAFARLGSRVVLIDDTVEHSDLLMDVERELSEFLKRDGVDTRLGCRVERIEPLGHDYELCVRETASEPQILRVERVVLVPPLRPDLASLGLIRGGVDHANLIAIDDRFRVGTKGVWAAGGVTGEPCFDGQSRLEGRLAARAAVDGARARYRREQQPCIIATDPPMAYVGLGVEAASRQGIEALSARVRLAATPRVASADVRGSLTAIADPGGRIIGGVAVGRSAPQLIAVLARAVRLGYVVEQLAEHAAYGGIEEQPLVAVADQLRGQRPRSIWQRLTGRSAG